VVVGRVSKADLGGAGSCHEIKISKDQRECQRLVGVLGFAWVSPDSGDWWVSSDSLRLGTGLARRTGCPRIPV
jgi:hypothetical protein